MIESIRRQILSIMSSNTGVFKHGVLLTIVGVFVFLPFSLSASPREAWRAGVLRTPSSVFRFASSVLHAQTAEELQSKIDERNDAIAQLEKDIKSYEKQIQTLSKEANTLQATIKSLSLTKKQLEAKIAQTEDKISAKTYQIQQLGKQIIGKESDISYDERIIARSYAELHQMGDRSLVELLLSNDSLAKSIDRLDQLSLLQRGIQDRIASLNDDKQALEVNREASEKAKKELLALNKQLSDERKIVLATTAEQNSLLKQTNQSEASYKRMLAEKKAQAEAFEREITDLESQLNILINPDSIPHTGSGVLSWPLANVFITQYFGNTPFATANPQIYNGRGHTGVDFRATIGTPIKAALGGEVVGVDNTDIYPGCYSYGKWIMVKHANGLSTLYAHLSLQSVKIGDTVSTGQVIGYSGNTGYSTGPHLHFGVYASEGVRIQKFTTSKNCKGATIPIADYSAYLNPLSYL